MKLPITATSRRNDRTTLPSSKSKRFSPGRSPTREVPHLFNQFRIRFGLALQPQSPQFLDTVAKPLLRCVVFRSCLWSVDFSLLAGFEKSIEAVELCVVMLGHTHQPPESQKSSNFRLCLKGKIRSHQSAPSSIHVCHWQSPSCSSC